MKKLLIKIAKFIFNHVGAFDLTYEDKEVVELGELIEKMESEDK